MSGVDSKGNMSGVAASRIVNCKRTVSIEWEIPEFSSYTRSGERIQSPQFLSGFNENWSLIIWPNGNTKKDTCVHLALLSSSVTSASYQLSIQPTQAYGTSYRIQCNSDGSTNFNGKTLISHKIGPKTDFWSKKAIYFPNNTLKIFCKLTTERQNKDNQVDFCSRSQMLKDMGGLLAKKDFSDVNIAVNEASIPAHTCILAARSPVFKEMFSSTRKKTVVQIGNFGQDVVLEMLKYIYTGSYPKPELVPKLVALAEVYNLSELLKVCEKILIRSLSTKNFCPTIVLSKLHKMEELKKACMDFGVVHMNDIIKTKEFDEIMKKDPCLVKGIFEKYVNVTQ